MGNNHFTLKSDSILNQLITDCGISVAFRPDSSTKVLPQVNMYKGLWDTGATGITINQKIVDDLKLQPVGTTQVFHADGESIANVFLVNIYLPNNIGIIVRAVVGKLTGFDVLIGMEVINRGDFSITNFEGKTTFSFRIPSQKEVDFSKEIEKSKNTPVSGNIKIQRNDPCPCGSGKKYKQCHGK